MDDFEVTVRLRDGRERTVQIRAADRSTAEWYVMRTTFDAVELVSSARV
jgi:hypothetical protein